MLTQEYLKSILKYDPETGIFTWLVDHGKKIKIGNIVKKKHCQGYVAVQINHKGYLVHRLAWLYMTGDWPKVLIDHINRVRNDNRWCNLREADYTANARNSKIRKFANKSLSNGITGIMGMGV